MPVFLLGSLAAAVCAASGRFAHAKSRARRASGDE
eukprot:CAMPEP_0117574090 /NCGR_PEP_ID=MMETSP0784-20121206/61363_1 /TAXON_ID=39447 /ORGANISM="" /LENGTH=34 /DNA_ID= /DNA_START= /DNA_END= /DNA_ORIENTATION=